MRKLSLALFWGLTAISTAQDQQVLSELEIDNGLDEKYVFVSQTIQKIDLLLKE